MIKLKVCNRDVLIRLKVSKQTKLWKAADKFSHDNNLTCQKISFIFFCHKTTSSIYFIDEVMHHCNILSAFPCNVSWKKAEIKRNPIDDISYKRPLLPIRTRIMPLCCQISRTFLFSFTFSIWIEIVWQKSVERVIRCSGACV